MSQKTAPTDPQQAAAAAADGGDVRLYSPDGREAHAGDPSEVTSLLARGYTLDKPRKS